MMSFSPSDKAPAGALRPPGLPLGLMLSSCITCHKVALHEVHVPYPSHWLGLLPTLGAVAPEPRWFSNPHVPNTAFPGR